MAVSISEAPAQTVTEISAGPHRKVLEAVENQCMNAQQPGDLDALWAKLAAYKSSGVGFGNSSRNQELDGAIFFVGQWRAYLEAHRLGNKTSAYQILQELLNDQRWLTLVRRSEVLNRLQEKEKFYQVRYSTETMEDLPKVISALENLERLTDTPGGMKKSLQPFLALQSLWNSRHDQNWNHLESACRLDSDDHIDVCQFKLLILAYALPGFLNLEAKYHVPPEEGENAPELLTSLINEATNNGDLVAQWRLKTYQGFLTENESPAFRQEVKAMDLCLEGQKYEAEGQTDLAVSSYRSALGCLVPKSTLEFAAARLNVIRATDISAYSEGMAKRISSLKANRLKESRDAIRRSFRPQQREEEAELWKKY